MREVVSAEWLKLRSVRSTHLVLGTATAFIGVGFLIAWQSVSIWDGLTPERREQFALSPLADLMAWVAGLCLGVLGVLAASSEYRSGTIRTTFIAVPRRRTVLTAKACVVGTVALLTGEVVTLATFFGTRLIIGDRPISDYQTSIADELPGLLVLGASVAVFALLGLGLSVVLRSAAGAIVTVVLLWHVVPVLAGLLPSPWDDRFNSLTLSALPDQVVGGSNENSIYGAILPPPVAAAVMVAYAAVPLLAAAFTLQRRDT